MEQAIEFIFNITWNLGWLDNPKRTTIRCLRFDLGRKEIRGETGASIPATEQTATNSSSRFPVNGPAAKGPTRKKNHIDETSKGVKKAAEELERLRIADFREITEADGPGSSSPDKVSKMSTRVTKRAESPSAYSKLCDLCNKPNDVLVRCQIDESQKWHFVCTKKCWKNVSGGAVDRTLDKPFYKYGGMWKNKHAGVSAKKPKAKKGVDVAEWKVNRGKYTKNDKVRFDGRTWVCGKSHSSSEVSAPGCGCTYWKEAG